MLKEQCSIGRLLLIKRKCDVWFMVCIHEDLDFNLHVARTSVSEKLFSYSSMQMHHVDAHRTSLL